MVRPLPKHRARDYETIFIVHPDTQVDAIEQIAGRVTDAIDRLEGKLLKAENWGKRRLAYPVRKQAQGYYVYLRYLGYSDLVHEIERNLRMIEPVLKYLTVKIDEDVDPAARPVNDGDISFVPQVLEEEPEPEAEAQDKSADEEKAEDGKENADDGKENADDGKETSEDAEEKPTDADSEETSEDAEEKPTDTDTDADSEEKDSSEGAEEEEAK